MPHRAPISEQIVRKQFVGDIAMTTSRFHSFHQPLADELRDRNNRRGQKPVLSVAAK